MPLHIGQQRRVGNADPQSIRTEFERLRTNWTNGDWLRARNRYKVDCVGRLRTDISSGSGATHSHLREYIAASTVTHCADGWSFLGRAIDSDLRGDSGTACHLAYYAELRAAVSLLAAEGVGVFNQKHAVVDRQSRCDIVPGAGTHQFTWDALEYWATTPASADLLFSVVEPGGLPLTEWLSRFSVGAGFRSTLGKAWLKQWGLDLERLSGDRDARNIASYRPTSFTSCGTTSAIEAIEAAREIWTLCEPFGERQFSTLDRELLRYSLALTFKEMTGLSPKQAKKRYSEQVQYMLHAMAPQDLSPDMWLKFLTYESSPAIPQMFSDANGTATIKDPRHSKQVMARATLLLRVATGSAARLLSSLDDIDSGELRFWWAPLGEERGLWSSDGEPEHFHDLWADVRDALRDLTDWTDDPDTKPSYQTMWASNSGAAAVLGTMERTGLWGLGL